MKRLDRLKAEKYIVDNLRNLSFDCIDVCDKWYNREIQSIEDFGAPNNEGPSPEFDELIKEFAEKIYDLKNKKK